jgi:hypothetical protein
MLVTRTSMISGKEHTLDLPVTQHQLDLWQKERWLIQDAMPELTAAQREFIMTGITSQEWDAEFTDDDEG